MNLLRPYQQEVIRSVLDSVFNRKGLTFTVEIARQGGKNEISAILELLLLTRRPYENNNLVKCSPTFKPQAVTSMSRLKEKLNLAGYANYWTSEMGYILRLAQTRVIFLSADASANVVGNTAHLLLEVDEAQAVDEDKFAKEFRPMGSTTNVTNVLYGTTWDDSTLLEKMKQTNLELERRDGLRRHFRYDWQTVAGYNTGYLQYVEKERLGLGDNHPLFLTQYCLLPVHGGGGFLSSSQRACLQGDHARCSHPEKGKVYVAGIDLAGEAESAGDDFLTSLKPRQDSTVITIAEITPALDPAIPNLIPKTSNFKLNIVDHYSWTGVKHPDLYQMIIDLLHNVWHCRRIVVDATGIGQPVASFLKAALGSRVVPFVFTASSKSELGFNLLAAVNSGRLKMYAADNLLQSGEFWFEMERAKSHYRANRTLNFYVDPSEGCDDYLMSLALAVEAGSLYSPREARGI